MYILRMKRLNLTNSKKPQHSALLKAIELAGGKQESLAKLCGVRQQNVSKWLRREDGVPLKRVIDIEKALNGAITRHQLRPDFFLKTDFTRD